MADEIRELISKKDEIEKGIKEYLDVLQSVCLMLLIFREYSGLTEVTTDTTDTTDRN